MQGMDCWIYAYISAKGGRLQAEQDAVKVIGAQSIEIRVCIRTSFAGYDRHPVIQGVDAAALCKATLEKSMEKSYEELKAEHIADYRELYGRLELDLGEGREDLPPISACLNIREMITR